MKLQSLLPLMVTAIATVSAGNPAYLRGADSDPASGTKQFDFSDVNQADQTEQATLSLDGSGSDACPEKCPMDFQPVKDKNGVEYLNKCLLRLAECTDSSVLASSDMADVRGMFGSLEGTVELTGSGSNEHAEMDIGLLEMFGGKEGATRKRTGPADFLNAAAGPMKVFGDKP
ncbi:hypothetical protein JG688_00016740 [Phytophthora aleatoria]|uniref:Kazal-like domain-containing protein n=1 Tax=Phytophthora aleatoria TaxID=2496075 RepID=A0A8J5IF55_9STRA|nr:hypothetical protein JG688_00016740 [Phytophthora aleatoria]